MKRIKFLSFFLSSGLLLSCGEQIKEKEQKKAPKVVVKTIILKNESIVETKTFFGDLNFSKSTNFVAQQSGVITKLKVVPGQEVKKGQVVATFPPINHHLEVEQAKIQQSKSLIDYNRQKKLYEVGAVSQVSVEDIKTQLDMEIKALDQLQQVNMLRAPFTGTITQVHAKEGQEIGIDMPIFSIAQTNKKEVNFYVTPSDISDIDLESQVYFIKEGNRIEGTITKKSIQLDNRRKGYQVTAAFDNENIVFVGNVVDIHVQKGQPYEGIRIPVDVFRKQGEDNYVFVIKDGRAKKRKIGLGSRDEQWIHIVNGLNAEEELVVAGVDKLKDGTAVIIEQKK